MNKHQKHTALLQQIFDASSQAILVIDKYKTIIQVNKVACDFFAFEKAALIGLKLDALFPAINYKEGNYKGIWIHKKNGLKALVDLRVQTIHDNDIAEAAFYITNIADNLIFQSTHKINRNNLLNIESDGNIGTWHWIFDTDEQHWSDELYKICGLSPGDNNLNARTAVLFLHPDDRELARKTMNYAIENKTPYLYENRILRPDGTIRFIRAKGKMEFDSASKPIQISGTVKDITEIKKAEITIKKEKNLLFNYMDTASSIFLVINANHKIEFANRKAREVLKVLDSEIIGKDWFNSFIPKHNRKQLSTLFDQVIKGETVPPDTYENIILVENEERLIQWRNGILRDANKNIISIVSSGIDITEQTYNQKKLKEQIDKNAALLRAIPDMIFVQDNEGTFLDFHAPDPTKLLTSKNKVIGNNMKEILPAKVHKLFHQAQLRVLKKKQVEMVEYTIEELERTIFYEARIVPMNAKKLLTIIRDVTVEKKNEKELEESKRKLKIYSEILEKKVQKSSKEIKVAKEQIVTSNLNLKDQIQETQVAEKIALVSKSLSTAIAKNFPNGFIIVFSINSEILLKEGEAISQLKLNKFISEGMFVDDVSIVSEKQKKKIKVQIRETINGKHLRFEIKYKKKHFSVNTKPLLDENDTISSALFVYNDITFQKKIELKVQNALKKEQQLNELKSRFISMASHEFRTPLSAINTSAILIDKQNEPGKEEKREKYVGKIKKNVKNLVVILNDFLSLSKLEEGNITVHGELFDLIDFSKKLIEEIKITTKVGQNIIFSSLESKVFIKLDPKLVRHILLNLLSNSIKYSPEDSQINFKIKENSTHVSIEIKDQGIGIPKEEQKQLFERFFRARNTYNIEGTGIGLNIVKQYVELMNGTIDFKSQMNNGSTFKVKWPKPNEK